VDRHAPELSDLVVDYDPDTLERRDVDGASVLARLTGAPARARRVARRLVRGGGPLDRREIDGILVRSHLELQRLQEEFHFGEVVRALLAPMIQLARDLTAERPIRVVDLGSGLGYVIRWLAAHGALGEDVALMGADYNRALVAAAQQLADEERLSCRFVVGNAFALDHPVHVVISTGVLHHFRGDDLAAVFAQHERACRVGFIHLDIRPSRLAPLGAWIFHQARMREPLARFDGYWSAVRAHDLAVIRAAISAGAPSFAVGELDARPGWRGLLRILQAAIGVRAGGDSLRAAYAPFGARFEVR
jgi:SAM-dependent methyltransferase